HIKSKRLVMTIPSVAVINAGVAGCCTGLALSFPGNLHRIVFIQ
ncbi:hypothetical protein EE612_050921, partial [Oryza sativa]